MPSSEEFNLNYKFSDERDGNFGFGPAKVKTADFSCQVNLCNNIEDPIDIEDL